MKGKVKNIGMRFPAILTATIKPHDTNGIHIIAQTEKCRYKQYLENFKYVSQTGLFDSIFLADNSSSSYIESLSQCSKSLNAVKGKTFVQNFPVLNESLIVGKGFGEGQLISNMINSGVLNDYDSFFKITGRYKIMNLFRLIPLINNVRKEYPHIKFIAFRYKALNANVKTVSTVCFWSDLEFWKDFLNDCYKEVNDMYGLGYEEVLGKRLESLSMKGHQIGFSQLPLVIDSTNTKNNEPFESRMHLYSKLVHSYVAHYLKPAKSIDEFML